MPSSAPRGCTPSSSSSGSLSRLAGRPDARGVLRWYESFPWTGRTRRQGVSLGWSQAIAASPNSMDQRIQGRTIDLLPKMTDMDVDEIGDVLVSPPQVFTERGPGEDLARVTYQQFENRKLRGGEVNTRACPGHDVAD